MVGRAHGCTQFLALAREANRLRSVAADAADDVNERIENSKQMIAASHELIAKADALIELDRKMWG